MTINGVDANDVINVKDISAFTSVKGNDTSFTVATTGSKVTLDDSKNVYIDLSTKGLDDIKNTDIADYIQNDNTKKALIAVEGSNGIKFFSALGGSSSATITDLDIKLLGVTGETVDENTLSLA